MRRESLHQGLPRDQLLLLRILLSNRRHCLDWNWWVNNFLTRRTSNGCTSLTNGTFRQLECLVPHMTWHMKKARPANDKEAAIPCELELACTTSASNKQYSTPHPECCLLSSRP